MGYYTDYTLSLSTQVPAEVLEKVRQVVDGWNVFETEWDAEWYGSAKWYDHRKDMCDLSRQFPNVLFCLHGVGEGQDDLWDAYFLGGRMQYCPAQIIYEPFDPEKLEELPTGENLP